MSVGRRHLKEAEAPEPGFDEQKPDSRLAEPANLAIAGLMQDGVVVERHQGTPQGGLLSPRLANLLLDDLDKELEQLNRQKGAVACCEDTSSGVAGREPQGPPLTRLENLPVQ